MEKCETCLHSMKKLTAAVESLTKRQDKLEDHIIPLLDARREKEVYEKLKKKAVAGLLVIFQIFGAFSMAIVAFEKLKALFTGTM